MAAFNEHNEAAANGWGPVTITVGEPGQPRHKRITILPALYQCCVCGAGPMPFQSFPRFLSIRICGRCYPLGHCDTLRRV